MPDFENLRLFTLTVRYPAEAYLDRMWCTACSEPVIEDADGNLVHQYDGTILDNVEDETYNELNRDWEPEGWLSDPDDRAAWVERFGDEKFFWPKADKVYFTKGTARSRARLLESYGAKVDIVESEPVIWLTPERIQQNRIAELEAELASLRSVS
ncbi:hypothetical protein LLS1_18810 [Leifsonia sp. LS1]|uniref:hypothetical protein n=1 Tax=Leifsonia sp. LS1 TaxID=2828483 RepID=UPI001CFE63E7|nr:hypothetical protein [Leifsonia sp. LS1]GIT80212.1 hypothetical protein LLS1_18810 [Leifsonia sp. LS1]